MEILVAYDSFFGNTEKIALALGNHLSIQADVGVFRVENVEPAHLDGLDLLIVGSPTRGFKPTKGVTAFIKKIPGLQGVKVAAFDTRIAPQDTGSRVYSGLAKVFGYAAEPITNSLKKKGGELLIQPEGFFVKDSQGPLKDGELERATNWAKLIMQLFTNP